MAEELDTTLNNADGGGKQPDGGKSTNSQDGGQEPPVSQDDKTFTQAELDAVLKTRLDRERQKLAEQFGDYDDLKTQAAEWKQHQDAQKSELEKLQEQATQAQQERDDAIELANKRLRDAAIISEASKAGFANPQDAIVLLDHSGVEIDDKGNVQGVSDAIKKLADEKKYLLTSKQPAPNVDGGAGGGKKGGKPAPTEAEIRELAAVYGVNAEHMAAGYGVALGTK